MYQVPSYATFVYLTILCTYLPAAGRGLCTLYIFTAEI
jgi:hypothetical protein